MTAFGLLFNDLVKRCITEQNKEEAFNLDHYIPLILQWF